MCSIPYKTTNRWYNQAKLESIEDFKAAKAQSDENLKLLHKQQYARMLRSDKAGMDALDEKIKAEEARQDALKTGFAQAMGAGIHGKSGNMLLGTDDEPKMYAGADGEGKDAFFGYRPEDYKDEKTADTLTGSGAGGGAGGSWDDDADSETVVTYVSELDYNTQSEELKRQLETRQDFVDGYAAQMAGTSLTDGKYDLYQNGYNRNLAEVQSLQDQIGYLEEQRNWSEKFETVKDDPLFNTTGFVNNQHDLGNIPFGSSGTASGNCCGSIAAHNVNLLLGEDSVFAEVFTNFNDNSKLLFEGKLGVNPAAIQEYFEDRGHSVKAELATTETISEPGVYIYMYIWETNKGEIGAHYVAMKNDGNTLDIFNNPKSLAATSISLSGIDQYMLTFNSAITGEAGLGYLMKIE